MEKNFVRYEASTPNGRVLHSGIFALANGLAKDGRLSAEDWASWRSANDQYDAAYPDPSTVDRSIYDRAINPTTQSWFKRTAAHLVTGVEFYTDLLHRYGVGWRVLDSNDPGKVLYEDDAQIVVAPHQGCDRPATTTWAASVSTSAIAGEDSGSITFMT